MLLESEEGYQITRKEVMRLAKLYPSATLAPLACLLGKHIITSLAYSTHKNACQEFCRLKEVLDCLRKQQRTQI